MMTCKTCAHWMSYRDFYDDPWKPYDEGYCVIGVTLTENVMEHKAEYESCDRYKEFKYVSD